MLFSYVLARRGPNKVCVIFDNGISFFLHTILKSKQFPRCSCKRTSNRIGISSVSSFLRARYTSLKFCQFQRRLLFWQPGWRYAMHLPVSTANVNELLKNFEKNIPEITRFSESVHSADGIGTLQKSVTLLGHNSSFAIDSVTRPNSPFISLSYNTCISPRNVPAINLLFAEHRDLTLLFILSNKYLL